MLSLRDITISIADEMPLISGLSVDIEPGSLRLIQGASGSGKSTLLSVICGTADRNVHATGDVLLNGRVVSGLDAEDRRIGLMFQDPLLFPHMSIGDNLAIALAAHHRHDRKARVSDALELAGLAGFEGSANIHDLLGGGWLDQKIRLHFWRVPFNAIPKDDWQEFMFREWDCMQHKVNQLSAEITA